MVDFEYTKARFMENTKNHSMEIRHDDDCYRHLVFRKEKSSTYRFDLITYPGGLLIRGDMGSYSFERVRDMFEWFAESSADAKGGIQPDYWREKLKSSNGEIKEFCIKEFKKNALEWAEGIKDHVNNPTEGIDRIIAEFEEQGEDALYAEITNLPGFNDFWEVSSKVYTFRFIWCLYSIVWGINQYNAAKEKAEASESETKAEPEADQAGD